MFYLKNIIECKSSYVYNKNTYNCKTYKISKAVNIRKQATKHQLFSNKCYLLIQQYVKNFSKSIKFIKRFIVFTSSIELQFNAMFKLLQFKFGNSNYYCSIYDNSKFYFIVKYKF